MSVQDTPITVVSRGVSSLIVSSTTLSSSCTNISNPTGKSGCKVGLLQRFYLKYTFDDLTGTDVCAFVLEGVFLDVLKRSALDLSSSSPSAKIPSLASAIFSVMTLSIEKFALELNNILDKYQTFRFQIMY